MASKSESKAIPSTTLLVTIKKYNNMQGAESMQLDLSRAFPEDDDREAFVAWLAEAAGEKEKLPHYTDIAFGEQDIQFRVLIHVCDVLDAICHFGGWSLVGSYGKLTPSIFVFTRHPPLS